MKLVSFGIATPFGSATRVGCLDGSRVVDLQTANAVRLRERGLTRGAAERLSRTLLPSDMVEFIEGQQLTLDTACEAMEWARSQVGTGPDGEQLWYEAGTYRPLAPVPHAPLIRDFMGFEEHLLNIYPRMGRAIPPEWYEMPVYYKGNSGSVAADRDAIPMPSYADELDFEFELAAVIGPGGANINPSDATRHIYGFTIYNDFSARTMQTREMTVGLGPAKGKDFIRAHAFGPYLVTRDEIPDVYSLRMVARVNDEIWCDSNSSTIHWTFEQMIARASMDEDLRAGEIFGSGTVGNGSGAERGQFLGVGDSIDLEVEGLGTLHNTIAARLDGHVRGSS